MKEIVASKRSVCEQAILMKHAWGAKKAADIARQTATSATRLKVKTYWHNVAYTLEPPAPPKPVAAALTHLGWMPCRTPACGWKDAAKPSENGLSDVVQIGKLTRLVCQRCGGNWGIAPHEYNDIRK